MAPIATPKVSEQLAESSWLVSHLTKTETMEIVGIIKRIDDAEPDALPDAQTAYDKLISIATDRAEKRPIIEKQEYLNKFLRAERIRSLGRPLSQREDDELDELNDWLDKRRCFNPETGKVGPA
jgi:hypothetical protein